MPDTAKPSIANPSTDPTVPQDGNRHGADGHYSGQEPGSFDSPSPESIDASSHAGGTHRPRESGAGAGQPSANIPPESGHRATVDRRTGEVHGAGMSAGGGQDGEQPDTDNGGSALGH